MSLLELLTRLKSASDRDEINRIILELEFVIRRSFLRRIARLLSSQSTFSPDRVIDDAEDVLQVVLMKFFEKPGLFRGRSEAEAESFVHTIVTRTFLDVAKTPSRRDSIWRSWFNGWKKSSESDDS